MLARSPSAGLMDLSHSPLLSCLGVMGMAASRQSRARMAASALYLCPSRAARKMKEVLSLGYHGNVVDLW
jgi:hypothetical protein